MLICNKFLLYFHYHTLATLIYTYSDFVWQAFARLLALAATDYDVSGEAAYLVSNGRIRPMSTSGVEFA